jgi:hypothetical protein
MVRRLMEPRHWSDRVLYALQAVMIPYSAAILTREGYPITAIIVIVFWVPFTFYTIEWLLKKLAD